MPSVPEPRPPETHAPDPYRGVVILIAGLAGVGTIAALLGGAALGLPVLLEAAVTLLLSTGVLIAVATTQALRAALAAKPEVAAAEPRKEDAVAAPRPAVAATEPGASGAASTAPPQVVAAVGGGSAPATAAPSSLGPAGTVLVLAAGVAALLTLSISSPRAPSVRSLGATVAVSLACLAAAGIAALVARYFARIDPGQLPEAPGLARGARLASWVVVLAAASSWLAWAGRLELETLLFVLVVALNVSSIYSLSQGVWSARRNDGARTLRLDYLVLELFGSRANPLASVLDTAERRLGVDLRSTWALIVVRRSVEPLLVALAVVGWLSTSLTRVGLDEQALVERFGVPVGTPLDPGLHLDWPWPVSRVIREPVLRVNGLTVGHEGEERGGPENVLWAVEHAKNEFVLVLGNGRDLVTIDGDVQYRIKDMAAWEYHWRDPEQMLVALAYRAVMRSTVDKTLAEALSQNIAKLTAQMKAQVQADADALGLGVEVVAFTMGGMHPPVPVAAAYQEVVSAQLGRVTASVEAQRYLNMNVPAAEASAVSGIDGAKAEAAEAEARATGEAWSFRTLETQYRTAPEEYKFRRRLETLESALRSRQVTIIDQRIQRDGGALWLKE